MKMLIAILIIVAALACTPTSVAPTPVDQPTPTPRHTPTPSYLVVSIDEIWDAYAENEARANQTYKEKDLRLTFVIDEIEDDHVIVKRGFLDQTNLSFPKDELVKFNIGDSITAICRLEGLQLDTWLEFEC